MFREIFLQINLVCSGVSAFPSVSASVLICKSGTEFLEWSGNEELDIGTYKKCFPVSFTQRSWVQDTSRISKHRAGSNKLHCELII